MPTLAERLAAVAKNPKARAAIDKARQQAAKPENRARIEQLRARWTRRRPGAKS
jgi:hypothetical protein